jgi:hypothetical protein
MSTPFFCSNIRVMVRAARISRIRIAPFITGGGNMRLAAKGKAGQPPKSVAMEMMFWMTDGGVIHLATNDKDQAANSFHIAVRKDGSKPSGHPYLYRELAKCLKSAGARMP